MPNARRASAKVLHERVAQLSIALLVKDGEDPPTEFRIFGKGACETSKGIYKFTEASAKKCMAAAANYGNDFLIDYGHAAHSFLVVDPAEAGKAAGWFRPETRDGELWATDVRWTPTAEQKLTDREYRYFSPVFAYSQNGEIEELRSVGLTNLPATYGQEPLMASAALQSNPSQPPEPAAMELAQLIALLSMSASATEADVMAELARRGAQLAELSAITGQKELGGVLGTVKAWKAGSDTVAALTQRISELEKKATEAQVTEMLTAAKAEGRVTPALEPQLRTMAPDQLKAFLSALPVFPGAAPARELPADGQMGPNGGALVTLTQEEQFIAQRMGTSLTAVAAAKASANGQLLVVEVPPKKAAGAAAK